MTTNKAKNVPLPSIICEGTIEMMKLDLEASAEVIDGWRFGYTCMYTTTTKE
jgi:hypothetical protein